MSHQNGDRNKNKHSSHMGRFTAKNHRFWINTSFSLLQICLKDCRLCSDTRCCFQNAKLTRKWKFQLKTSLTYAHNTRLALTTLPLKWRLVFTELLVKLKNSNICVLQNGERPKVTSAQAGLQGLGSGLPPVLFKGQQHVDDPVTICCC